MTYTSRRIGWKWEDARVRAVHFLNFLGGNEEMHPPRRHWEYTKSPWHFGLLIKIFRRDPQLALHVASVMYDPDNVPVSRAELRRQKQGSMLREKQSNANKENRGPPRPINIENARTSSSLSRSPASSGQQSAAANVSGSGRSEFADSAVEEKRVNDARILISTTHASQHLLNKLDEIERTVAALEKMKPYIPPELYAAKMRCAFVSLPDFGTYDTDVCDVVAPTASNDVAPTASKIVAPTASTGVAPTALNGRTTSKRVYENDDNEDDDNVHQEHNTVKKTKKPVDDDDSILEECDNNDRVLDDESDGSDEESLHALVKELRQKHTPAPVLVHIDNDNVVDDFWERNDKDYFQSSTGMAK